MRKLVAPSGREPWTVTGRRWIESPAKRKCTKNLDRVGEDGLGDSSLEEVLEPPDRLAVGAAIHRAIGQTKASWPLRPNDDPGSVTTCASSRNWRASAFESVQPSTRTKAKNPPASGPTIRLRSASAHPTGDRGVRRVRHGRSARVAPVVANRGFDRHLRDRRRANDPHDSGDWNGRRLPTSGVASFRSCRATREKGKVARG
jgi:hypothetical protein